MGIILMQSIEVVNDICAEYLSAADVFKRKHIFFICDVGGLWYFVQP
jgi:hypothetical protein